MDIKKYKLIGISSAAFFIILIVGLIALRVNYLNKHEIDDNRKEPKTIINDSRTYNQSWRMPRGTEYADIGKLIIQKNIKVCGEYHVKQVTSGEYIIACSPDGNNWHYFVAYTKIGKFYRASDEMIAKLKPPR